MLQGIRVIELASYVAGPGACGLLADWGADVIKVETQSGDPWRLFFASVGRSDAENRVFETDNRGKRSIVLDITDTADAAVMRDLIASADVFVTNARPGSLKRAGLDWDTLHAASPGLIFANITGYGPTGPDANKPGFDANAFWARSGLCALTSIKDHDPAPLRTGIGDHVVAISVAGAVCAALLHRERTGEGQKVETSLLRMGVYAGASEHAVQLQTGRLASTKGRHEAFNPLNSYFRTSDGRWFLIMSRQGSGEWKRIATAAGLVEYIDDERFAGGRARKANAAAMVDLLDASFAAMSWDEMSTALDEQGVIWGPVQTVAQVTEDPQAEAAGCYVQVAADTGEPLRVPAGPVDFSALSKGVYRRAPLLGEHGAAIREELATLSRKQG